MAGQGDRAVDRHPAHQLRVQEVPRLAPDLPDPLVLLLPAVSGGIRRRVRRGISVWARVGPDAERRAVRSLGDDLAAGRWAERNPDLIDLESAELGLRLLIA
jgi:hypothetical protein